MTDTLTLKRVHVPVTGENRISEHRKLIAILDTETDGLDPKKDNIIELAISFAEYNCLTGVLGRVVKKFESFNDPKRPLPDKIKKITGIKDEDLYGKGIDASYLEKLFANVSLIVSHNAAFDRKFMESFSPMFRDIPWGCSYRGVPWLDFGYVQQSQEILLMKMGYFYSSHRAMSDVDALYVLLASTLGEKTVLGHVLDSARKSTGIIYAVKAPFEAKDALKGHGYFWNASELDGKHRAWRKEVSRDEYLSEIAWLKDTLNIGKDDIDVVPVTALNRFSDRV